MTNQATSQQFDHVERQGYIGASELAVIMGLSPYKTPLDLFNEKTGRTAPFEGNNHTRRGQRLEHIAAELFTEITEKKLRRQNRGFIHPEYQFIRGHIDRLIEGEKTIAEIKVVSLASYRKLQREGLPESYLVQLNAYLGLSGYGTGVFIVFCPDQYDLVSFNVSFDQQIYEASIKAACGFWFDHVAKGIAPTDEKPDSSHLDFEKVGGEITVRDDQPFADKAVALKEAADLKRDAEELYETAKQDILDAIEGVCGYYQCPGVGRIYYTQSAGRVTFDKKALAAAHPEIDLKRFEKQGKPFNSLRTFLGGRILKNFTILRAKAHYQ